MYSVVAIRRTPNGPARHSYGPAPTYRAAVALADEIETTTGRSNTPARAEIRSPHGRILPRHGF